MSDLTVIKTEMAKVCLFDYGQPKPDQPFEELYLSEASKQKVDEDEEPDHLIIQKIATKEGGIMYHINGKEVERRIIEEIVRFLMD